MHFHNDVLLFSLHAFTILNDSARNDKFTVSNKTARLRSYRKCFHLQRRRVKQCLQTVGFFSKRLALPRRRSRRHNQNVMCDVTRLVK